MDTAQSGLPTIAVRDWPFKPAKVTLYGTFDVVIISRWLSPLRNLKKADLDKMLSFLSIKDSWMFMEHILQQEDRKKVPGESYYFYTQSQGGSCIHVLLKKT